MKSLDKIPTSRLERSGNLLKAGAKIGVNYLKYYGNKVTKTEEEAKNILHEDNAGDIYDSLKELKGSALKVAQMLSMEKSIMPAQYVEKFSLSQFSVPPLSGPLVKKSFRRYFGKNPDEIFDSFTEQAINAASIGQVHKAWKDGKELAVKIQYPGVADSIASDLKMVKPIAIRMFNIQKEGSEAYFQEVEDKLREETDYTLELRRSQEIAKACQHIPNLRFANYYPEFSSEKVLTMDWMQGEHFSEYTARETPADERNKLGQTLWNFYMFQIYRLHQVHADPHPGNFLVSPAGELQVIDFGCVKEIPEDFSKPYFQLFQRENNENAEVFTQKLYELEILRESDSAEEKKFFAGLFKEMLCLFTAPFHEEEFDFADEEFFQKIAAVGQKYAQMNELRTMNTNRGSRHFIYMNRTFFGLFNMLHELKANVRINDWKNYQ